MTLSDLIPTSPLGIFLAGSVLVIASACVLAGLAGWVERLRRRGRPDEYDDWRGL